MSYLEQSLALLQQHNINSASSVEYNVNGTIHTLRVDNIIKSYMQASEEAQEVFYKTLQKAFEEDEVKSFFEKMGQLLIMSSLSKEFPT